LIFPKDMSLGEFYDEVRELKRLTEAKSWHRFLLMDVVRDLEKRHNSSFNVLLNKEIFHENGRSNNEPSPKPPCRRHAEGWNSSDD
jgi:hypothetical protein